MIDRGEIRRIAGTLGVDPRVIDHDYVLGCFLHYLSLQDEVRKAWVFKGGTSLAKCHFPEYRFSEDLDFTALTTITDASLKDVVDRTKQSMQDSIGIPTDFQNSKVDVIQDDYGQESFEARIYYRGPWEYGGSARSLQIHVNRDETIVFSTPALRISHHYSDKPELPQASLQAYALEEMLAEKLRALSGQRKFAIARDLYDVQFLSRQPVSLQDVFKALPQKFATKGISVQDIDVDKLSRRKTEYEINWKNNLEYLIPEPLKVPFEDAWTVSLAMLSQARNTHYQGPCPKARA
jgi:predicted nucleotidyltransferase component of viral defense system